ncbi:hypothetical protein N9251_02215 [Gammaproteobacteria bacterium]|nr:hypothetical protein [Gammaproteobacteria bacterium]
MKLFYKRALLFIVILFTIALTFDLIISNHLQTSPARRYKTWTEITEGTMTYNALIFGSSEAFVACDAQILSDSTQLSFYNSSINGSNLDRNRGKINLFEAYYKAPKLVVITPSFYFLKPSNHPYEHEQFFPFFYNNKYRETVLPCVPVSWAQSYIPMYRYFGNSKQMKEGLGLTPMYAYYKTKDGFSPIDKPYDSVLYADKEIHIFKYQEPVLQELKTFIANQQHKGVKVVIALLPIYKRSYERISNLGKFDSLYQSLSQEFKIPVLNYMTCPVYNDTTNYYNDFHMNRTGATKMSKILGHDLKKILK